MKMKLWVYCDSVGLDFQFVHDLPYTDVLSCFRVIAARAFRQWGWPKGAHFVLNQTSDSGTFTVCRGNVTHNEKILIEA